MKHNTDNTTPNALAAALTACMLTVAFSVSTPIHASPVITNGDFEIFTGTFGTDGAAQLTSGSTALTGWTIVGQQVAILKAGNNYNLTPSSGSNFLDLTGYSFDDQGDGQGVSQLVTGFDVGKTYRLSIDIGISNDSCIPNAPNPAICDGPVTITATMGGVSKDFLHSSTLPSGNEWSTYNLDFTASSNTALLQFVLKDVTGAYAGLDNVRIVTPSVVPEPPSLALASMGLGLLLMLRASRRSTNSPRTKRRAN